MNQIKCCEMCALSDAIGKNKACVNKRCPCHLPKEKCDFRCDCPHIVGEECSAYVRKDCLFEHSTPQPPKVEERCEVCHSCHTGKPCHNNPQSLGEWEKELSSKFDFMREDFQKTLTQAIEAEIKKTADAIEMSKQGWVEQGRAEERQKLVEMIKGMKTRIDPLDKAGADYDTGYNQALDDLISALTPPTKE